MADRIATIPRKMVAVMGLLQGNKQNRSIAKHHTSQDRSQHGQHRGYVRATSKRLGYQQMKLGLGY